MSPTKYANGRGGKRQKISVSPRKPDRLPHTRVKEEKAYKSKNNRTQTQSNRDIEQDTRDILRKLKRASEEMLSLEEDIDKGRAEINALEDFAEQHRQELNRLQKEANDSRKTVTALERATRSVRKEILGFEEQLGSLLVSQFQWQRQVCFPDFIAKCLSMNIIKYRKDKQVEIFCVQYRTYRTSFSLATMETKTLTILHARHKFTRIS